MSKLVTVLIVVRLTMVTLDTEDVWPDCNNKIKFQVQHKNLSFVMVVMCVLLLNIVAMAIEHLCVEK